MWSRIKNLIGASKPRTVSNLSRADVPTWFSKRKSARLDELSARIKEASERIKDAHTMIEQRCQELGEAGFLNDAIPQRVRQTALGNREEFLRKVRLLLEETRVGPDASEVVAASKKGLSYVRGFAQDTTRQVRVLQEFFAKETQRVLEAIGLLEKGIHELIACREASDLLASAQRVVDALAQLDEQKELRKEELEREKDLLAVKVQERAALVDRIREVEQSEEHKDYLSKREALKEMNDKIKQAKDELVNSFSQVRSALKKYSYLTFENTDILERYFDAPVEALIEDRELQVVRIIDGARNALEKGEIELKEKKRERALQVLSEMGPDFFHVFTRAYGLMKKDERELVDALTHSSVARDLKKARSELDGVEDDINAIKRKIREIEEEHRDPADSLYAQFGEIVSQVFDEEVRLV